MAGAGCFLACRFRCFAESSVAMSEPRNKAPSAAKRHTTLLGALPSAEGLEQLLDFAIATKRVQINMRTVEFRIFECDGAGQGRDRILVQDSRCRIGLD